MPVFFIPYTSLTIRKLLSYSRLKSPTIIDSHPEYRLDTELVKLEQPLIGVNFLVKSRIKYRIVDLKTDETVFYQAIDSQYTAKFTDSLYGVKRLRLASEGSIKNNITSLINYLDEEQA